MAAHAIQHLLGMEDPLVGQRAPSFKLPSAGTGELYSPPIGKKPIAIFFFPKAMTIHCTLEACAFRDAQEKRDVFLRHPDLEVIGISRDPIENQTTFQDKYGLRYPIVSDTNRLVNKVYGVKVFFGSLPERKTVFIGGDGIVQGVYVANVRVRSHVRWVEKQLKRLELQKTPSDATSDTMFEGETFSLRPISPSRPSSTLLRRESSAVPADSEAPDSPPPPLPPKPGPSPLPRLLSSLHI
ncbi:hypothetical protein Q8F55_000162 [Vanrija albida]|uniref:thioredoxin-dependent peroxiredoxin n=1 Tax=Vanrija albida TaxID=181172 RepID=A0ABR3QD37_9TREE